MRTWGSYSDTAKRTNRLQECLFLSMHQTGHYTSTSTVIIMILELCFLKSRSLLMMISSFIVQMGKAV